ncbi:MAG: AbrB/MazE/SpoVT family DNA-binding domain-containing protein [Candidatus Diapherotrites archaeon]|uniref:AbrB/MazE/SpoVT family DNA-binding domain-containing protein n=1 Tax=Candidatus Iainarchaeum sp. TaxID=3101447 RepID=A0A8T3YL31_9ARCH|nr:AbrB/MazE/SpoVT family DNA-binding domain-containing protein [Candidatus Diapherotrites archaeon]
MAEKMVVVRKWGNSVGVAFPADFAKKEGIRPNDSVIVSVKKVVPLRELFGSLKTKKPTEEIMKEIRKGWD